MNASVRPIVRLLHQASFSMRARPCCGVLSVSPRPCALKASCSVMTIVTTCACFTLPLH